MTVFCLVMQALHPEGLCQRNPATGAGFTPGRLPACLRRGAGNRPVTSSPCLQESTAELLMPFIFAELACCDCDVVGLLSRQVRANIFPFHSA